MQGAQQKNAETRTQVNALADALKSAAARKLEHPGPAPPPRGNLLPVSTAAAPEEYDIFGRTSYEHSKDKRIARAKAEAEAMLATMHAVGDNDVHGPLISRLQVLHLRPCPCPRPLHLLVLT